MSGIFTSLFRLALADLPLYRSAQTRRAAGESVALRTAAAPRGFAALCAMWRGVEYQGWINIDHLMRRRYPALDGMAWRALDKSYALDLLSKEDLARELPAPKGGWTHVRLVELVERELPAERLLCFDAPGCVYALFRGFPEAPAINTVPDLGTVPLTLCFSVGTTCLPLSLLATVSSGDVLLICNPRNVVLVGAQGLCEFIWDGENIMLNEQLAEGALVGLQNESSVDTASRATPLPFDIAALPITVEFVLWEERVTVTQLAGYHAGMVMPLRSGPDEVMIRANGQPFGRGELIQVGDRLAVEVKDLWRTKPAASDE